MIKVALYLRFNCKYYVEDNWAVHCLFFARQISIKIKLVIKWNFGIFRFLINILLYSYLLSNKSFSSLSFTIYVHPYSYIPKSPLEISYIIALFSRGLSRPLSLSKSTDLTCRPNRAGSGILTRDKLFIRRFYYKGIKGNRRHRCGYRSFARAVFLMPELARESPWARRRARDVCTLHARV